jgi:hypothetical protein
MKKSCRNQVQGSSLGQDQVVDLINMEINIWVPFLLTYLLTYSKEQRTPCRTKWFTASKEIPRILWNPKVRYHIHKYLPPVPILSQLNPVPAPTSHFLKIQLNLSIYAWVFQVVSFPQVSSPKPCISLASPLPIHASCPVHLIFLDFITQTMLGEEYRSLSSLLCSFHHFPVTSSLLGPNILLSILL